MLVNSVTTSPAPSSRQSNLRAGLLTPDMGARNALEGDFGNIGWKNGVVIKKYG